MSSERHLIVVWHGSKRQAWVDVAQMAVSQLDARLTQTVRTASVDSFNEVLLETLSGGPTEIIVLPLFVAPGGHIFDDVDAAISESQSKFPTVSIRRFDTLLETPEVIDALIAAIHRA